MKKFGLIGACGYIAPRHLQAINDLGHKTVVAYDPMDSVGILDRFSRDVSYFKTYEEFNYFLKREKIGLDYLTVCSPNFLHAPHVLLGLELGADVVCEKPLVTNCDDIQFLSEAEQRYSKKIFTVLQLRCHPEIIALKDRIENETNRAEKYEIDLTYITSRGPWYHQTWKAQESKSGGIAANIGVHFFDMLIWVFGEPISQELHYRSNDTLSGVIELEKARVKWFLSIDGTKLPESEKMKGATTYRVLSFDEEVVEFSSGFTDLHTRVYDGILRGQGYGLGDVVSAIKLVEEIRGLNLSAEADFKHEMLES